jgi:hypothetical protein
MLKVSRIREKESDSALFFVFIGKYCVIGIARERGLSLHFITLIFYNASELIQYQKRCSFLLLALFRSRFAGTTEFHHQAKSDEWG